MRRRETMTHLFTKVKDRKADGSNSETVSVTIKDYDVSKKGVDIIQIIEGFQDE